MPHQFIRGNEAVARIAGQREEYLLKALQELQVGRTIRRRRCGDGGCRLSAEREEITALAHYLAHL